LRDRVLRGPQGRGRRPEGFERERTGSHFIAIDAGRVVSCHWLYPLANGILEVRHVAVGEAARGEGFGAVLCQHAEDWAPARGVRAVELSGRLTAQDFYEACGFVATGPECELDVAIAESVFRRLVLAQSILAFLFNMVVVALAVNAFASLA
jgi:N-acetylglutamate synthase-like GNAT family acetyltransferase